MKAKTILITFAVLTFSLTACSSSSKNLDNRPLSSIRISGDSLHRLSKNTDIRPVSIVEEKDYEDDSDKNVERTLKLKDFHGVSVNSSVDIHYTQGNTYKVVAKSNEYGFETTEISVKDGLLTCLKKGRDKNNGSNNKVILYITAPKMNVIKNDGRTSFYASAFTVDDMEINNKGVLHVKVESMKYSNFRIDNSGWLEIKGSYNGGTTDYSNSGVCNITADFNGGNVNYRNNGHTEFNGSVKGGAMDYSNFGVCKMKVDFDVADMKYENTGHSEFTGKVNTGRMIFTNMGVTNDKLDVEAESMSIAVTGHSNGNVNFKGQSMDITCNGIMEMKFDVDCDKLTSANTGRITLEVSGRADDTEFSGSGISDIKTEGLNKF